MAMLNNQMVTGKIIGYILFLEKSGWTLILPKLIWEVQIKSQFHSQATDFNTLHEAIPGHQIEQPQFSSLLGYCQPRMIRQLGISFLMGDLIIPFFNHKSNDISPEIHQQMT